MAVAPLSVEYSTKEPRLPGAHRRIRPRDQLAHLAHACADPRVDGLQRPNRGGRESRLTGLHVPVRQPLFRALQCFQVAQRQSEGSALRQFTIGAPTTLGPDRSVSANQSAEVAGPIVRVLVYGHSERAGAHKLVAGREMRPSRPTALRARSKFPASFG